jgi:signal transduction histidine kinase
LARKSSRFPFFFGVYFWPSFREIRWYRRCVGSGRPSGVDELERLAAVGEVAASAVHEIRNALQVAATSLWLAKQGGTPEGIQQHVAKAERATRTAQGVVDAVLGLARGERLVGESASVEELLTDARADLSAQAQWTDEGADVRLRGSPVLLARVFHVLFENAVAVGGANVRVATHATRTDSTIRVDVADDGPGVPPALREDIFRPLVTGREGGTGLGLSLAKRIVEAHGGTLRLARADEPQRLAGAHFVIELPGA